MTRHKLRRIIERNRHTMSQYDDFDSWKSAHFRRETSEETFKMAFSILAAGRENELYDQQIPPKEFEDLLKEGKQYG